VLFATSSLAARIDRAEYQIARTFTELSARRRADALIRPIGGTAALYSGPNEPWNKVVGLGFGTPVDEAALADIEREFDARGADLRVEFSTLADGAIAALLARRGYELGGFENVLGLALTRDVPEPAAGEVTVARASTADTRTWIETIVDGFGHPDVFDGPPPTESFDRDTLLRVFDDYTAAPGAVLYLARRHGEIAGGASIRIVDGLAVLTGASTLPAHRRRGVQSALLGARLADAARTGCDIAVVTTEPGSKSQANVQKIGFELLYARAILVRPARPVVR
jgi:GNAT superfamily N-acetyltransferase